MAQQIKYEFIIITIYLCADSVRKILLQQPAGKVSIMTAVVLQIAITPNSHRYVVSRIQMKRRLDDERISGRTTIS